MLVTIVQYKCFYNWSMQKMTKKNELLKYTHCKHEDVDLILAEYNFKKMNKVTI